MFHTVAFYKYARLPEAEELVPKHLDFCLSIGLKGRILLAPEGINGSFSGTPEQCRQYMDFVEQDPRLQDIDWKIDEEETLAFPKIHVRYKREIVHSGLYDIDPSEQTGVHLAPKDFLAMKDEPDVLILDVRSKYEHELGHFKNALTLDMDNFREFPDKVAELEAYKDKKILTYCTGGIKCEKASAFLLKQGFKEVYQLHGGIIKYGKEVGGQDFEGQCYVFDGRVQVPINTVNPTVITKCINCGKTEARMMNCANPHCNIHTTQCLDCAESLQGACSTVCGMAPAKRPYHPQGYYAKTNPRLEEIYCGLAQAETES